MSKKKEKPVTLRDLEGEIVRLESDEIEPAPEPAGLRGLFGDLLQQQSQQHAELLQALSASSQSTKEALVSAVKDSLQPDPQPAPRASHVSPMGLFEADVPIDHDSSEEEFLGWDFPEPGQAVHQEVSEPIVQLPGTSASAQSSCDQPEAIEPAPPIEGLYCQDKPPNWDPPVDLLTWFQGRNSKEVPPASVKEINENFIPQEKFQALFTAPPLPQAINDRLLSAPKYLTKVPKMVNDQLLRSQKELMVALKPLVEVLAFYFSTEFLTLQEFVPELAAVFDTVSVCVSYKANISFIIVHYLFHVTFPDSALF